MKNSDSLMDSIIGPLTKNIDISSTDYTKETFAKRLYSTPIDDMETLPYIEE